jgi:hypothetical protein
MSIFKLLTRWSLDLDIVDQQTIFILVKNKPEFIATFEQKKLNAHP